MPKKKTKEIRRDSVKGPLYNENGSDFWEVEDIIDVKLD